jgi:murein DD-endopeptidase MepM/ murein hydrolase activator NlpD
VQPVGRADEAIAPGQAMDENIASRRSAQLTRLSAVSRTRIGNVDRLVKLAMRIAEVEHINSFRRFVIALPRLRTDRLRAQRHFESLQNLVTVEKLERPLLFENQHAIRAQPPLHSRLRHANHTEQTCSSSDREHSDTHAGDYSRADSGQCYAGTIMQKPPLVVTLRFLFLGIVPVALSAAFAVPLFAASWSVRAEPPRLINGAPVLFKVKAPVPLKSLNATWLTHHIDFSLDSSTKTWFALAGVGFETAPGTYTLELSGEPVKSKAAEATITFSRKFSVLAGKYPKIEVKLSVEGKFTEPTPEQLKQIDEDKKVKQDYLNRVTPEREWSGRFAPPADAAISDVFGSQRIFNGKTSSPHLGEDFRVPSGTPVAAMNEGTVLLARPLYFEGNFVVIDHGQGLLTLYLHLSEFKVTEGEHVKRGQIVGLSGGTGRATGPHLHVAVRWQGTYLDPARLMQMSLP